MVWSQREKYLETRDIGETLPHLGMALRKSKLSLHRYVSYSKPMHNMGSGPMCFEYKIFVIWIVGYFTSHSIFDRYKLWDGDYKWEKSEQLDADYPPTQVG